MSRLSYPDLGDINGPFVGSHAVSEGWLTKNQLRSGLFSRIFQNAYVPAGSDHTHELRCRAAALIAPPTAVLTGCSAAVIRGLDFVGSRDPVEILVPQGTSFVSQRGMNIRRTGRGEVASEPWHDIGLATPMRMTLDILTNSRLHRSLPRVVGYLDAILHAGLVDEEAMADWLATRHDNGIVRARRAFALADRRAESIPESELRVHLVLGGLQPVPQVNVFSRAGVHLGRLDLAIEEHKLAIEYDGREWHEGAAQVGYDTRRRAAIEREGWRFIIVTKDWLYDNPRDVVETVRSALSR